MRKNINIYLAGKIKTHCWRHSIVGMRDNFCGDDYHACKENVQKLKNAKMRIEDEPYDNVYVTGPFFLSCDHSCYHGEGSHGLGIGGYDCYGYERTYTEQEVIDICKAQIKRADIVIAYINDDTCYGTLFELGLAKQMGKQIVTIFDNKERKRKMWFIAANSDYSTTVDETDTSYNYFESIYEADLIEYIRNKIKNYKWYR